MVSTQSLSLIVVKPKYDPLVDKMLCVSEYPFCEHIRSFSLLLPPVILYELRGVVKEYSYVVIIISSASSESVVTDFTGRSQTALNAETLVAREL